MIGYFAVGALGLIVIGLIIFNPEIRNYLLFKIHPGCAKNITFIKLQKGEQSIYILGTIHGAHLSVTGYSLWHIEAVIKNLHPDLVLVESCPEELNKDNWGDGPIEMLFSSLTAMELGIPVKGMDWWDLSLLGARRSNKKREDKMFAQASCHISNQRKILIITGFSHVPEFTQRFLREGYSRTVFPLAHKDKLFALTDKEELYPLGMAVYTKKRIELDREAIADANNAKLRKALSNSVSFRTKFLQELERHGESAEGNLVSRENNYLSK